MGPRGKLYKAHPILGKDGNRCLHRIYTSCRHSLKRTFSVQPCSTKGIRKRLFAQHNHMKPCQPRRGSMQIWPRVRANREHARVRTWNGTSGALGFAGYKVGMTHLLVTDNRATTKTKGENIFCPATIIECPPIKVAGIVFYKNSFYGPKIVSPSLSPTLDKEFARCVAMPKKHGKEAQDFDDVKLLV